MEGNFNFNLTVKENGINNNSLIFAKKKLNNNIQHMSVGNKNNNNNNEIKHINELNNNHGMQYDAQGNMNLNLSFQSTTGLKAIIIIDDSLTFRDAVFMYLKKIKVYSSDVLKHIVFLYNATKLDVEDNRKLREIFNGPYSKITVLDVTNILGA